jgi:hypothetical protein
MEDYWNLVGEGQRWLLNIYDERDRPPNLEFLVPSVNNAKIERL